MATNNSPLSNNESNRVFTTENKVLSTVKMNCGCNKQFNGSPAFVVESAIRHVQETGHTVDILGSIKSTKPKPTYVPSQYFKTPRKDNERMEI